MVCLFYVFIKGNLGATNAESGLTPDPAQTLGCHSDRKHRVFAYLVTHPLHRPDGRRRVSNAGKARLGPSVVAFWTRLRNVSVATR